MNIYQKLIEVRKVVPYLQKESKGYQFNYTGSSLVLGSLKTKMDELGLLLIPRVIKKEVSEHETAKGGKEYFTELCMEFTWVNAENPEETIVCAWYGQGLDSGEKGVGKAMTYAEKYFMLKFFNIATDKDDPDSFQKKMGDDLTPPPQQQSAHRQQAPPSTNVSDLATDAQVKKMFAMVKAKNIPEADVKTKLLDLGKSSSKELTKPEINKIFEWIDKYGQVGA